MSYLPRERQLPIEANQQAPRETYPQKMDPIEMTVQLKMSQPLTLLRF
jgi:hypothetical protein